MIDMSSPVTGRMLSSLTRRTGKAFDSSFIAFFFTRIGPTLLMPQTTASRRLSQAAQLLSEEQYAHAILVYESILRETPDHADALNDAAVAYRKTNRYQITEDYLRRALQIDPSHQNAFYNLVELLRGLKQPVEAALVFDQYQDRIPAGRQKATLEHALWPQRTPAPPLLDQDDRANGDALAAMWDQWGNKGWSANLGFAKQMVELAAATDQPILECGSGYTTFLLGHLASQRGVEVWTLEHNEKWHAYINRALERADLHRANVCLTPLCDYGDFDWYDVAALNLPDAFGLVVCDGPPGRTRGGRSGFFPVMRRHLAADCTILLDDVQRDDEMELAQAWAASGEFSLALSDADNKQFAILSRSDAPPPCTSAPPTPIGNAYPPLARTYRNHLAKHPLDTRVFFRAVRLLLDQGYKEEAREVFDTYEANVPESPGKQALRCALPRSSPPASTSSEGPICIGGCGSSGTNLLRRLLDMHSQVACGKELSVFDRPRLYDMSMQELRASYTAGEFKTLDEGIPFEIRLKDGSSYVGLRPGNYGDYYHSVPSVLELLDEAQTVPQFLDLYLSRYAQRQGKSIWAEKTPNNIYCAEQFLSTYPEGRFIQVLRDGRDVCLSLNQRRNFSLQDAVTRWVSAVEAGLRIQDHKRFYTVRYEDLVYDPEATLTALLEWLGLSFEPDMLAFTDKKEASIHGYAEEPIHSESAFRWKREWDQIDLNLRRLLDLSLHQHRIATGYESDAPPEAIRKAV
jgi:tetratricopeptide (TPR) repeat protein